MGLDANGEWNSIEMQSESGNLCSYKFKSLETYTDMYQIALSDYDNVKIGMYFFSNSWDQVLDYKVFRPRDCKKIKYCEPVKVNENFAMSFQKDDIVFSLEDGLDASFTLLPVDASRPMRATMEYRLVNKLEQRYIYETFLLLTAGVVLVVVFAILSCKALSKNGSNDMHQSRMRSDREERRLFMQMRGEEVCEQANHEGPEIIFEQQEDMLEDVMSHIDEKED